MNKITLILFATIILIGTAMFIAIFVARGYQLDFNTRQILPTGILVATSDPNGAEVFVNGKLKTATDTTLNLSPGNYDIVISKDGYYPWQKKVAIKTEEVFKTNAFLFPKVPDLRPLTLTGALNPSLSPDQTKIAYGVASASAEKNGVFVLDMNKSPLTVPLISSADIKQIHRNNFSGINLSAAKFLWGADNKTLIAYFGNAPTLDATNSARLAQSPQAAYLLDIDNPNDSLTPLTNLDMVKSLSQWEDLKNIRKTAQISKINRDLAQILTAGTQNISLSPDESKIFYQATASAKISQILLSYLPGVNPSKEERNLKPGNYYVYDLKEDKNYLIANCQMPATRCVWFPSSRHILSFSNTEISVMDYDGTNRAVVYAGPFIDSVVYSWPNWSKIVILTSLNQSAGITENLYTINLR